jgi:phospholipase/carboxylesterase
MLMPLPGVIVETGAEPVGVVIWLHGLGADGHDFEAIVPELALPHTMPLRFVFPHAPVRPVTINGGMRMRAWYDIVSFDAAGRADESGVLESCGLLDELLGFELQRGIDASRVVLAGFSQGGAIVLHYALANAPQTGGIVALSTYLALPKRLASEVASRPPQGRRAPVFMAHGSRDDIVPFEAGRQSAALVQKLGHPVDWREYPMGHAVCGEEIRDIRAFLLRLLGGSQATT